MVVDPDDANRVYLGGATVDGGASLFRCEITPSPRRLPRRLHQPGQPGPPGHPRARVPPRVRRELWVGCDGGVFTTPDARGGPELFEARNTGLGTMTLNGIALHPTEDSYAFCGAQDNGGLRYTGSEIWDHQLGGDGGATVINQARPDPAAQHLHRGERAPGADRRGPRSRAR